MAFTWVLLTVIGISVFKPDAEFHWLIIMSIFYALVYDFLSILKDWRL